MKNIFFLLLVVGFAVAVWINREKFPGFQNALPAAEENAPLSEPAVAGPKPARSVGAIPHPAAESTEIAKKTYPGLAIPGSAFNKKFIAFYTEAQRIEPELLARPDWPLKLAERTAISLGGAPMPTPTPAPAPLQPLQVKGSAMDRKPAR